MRNGTLTNTSRLAGKRLLIVEDEYFIASDLKRALEAQGAVVLGPVAGVDAALNLIARGAVDVAMLDVNLGSATCFPVAERLRALGVPFLFLTGYDDWVLPETFRDVPLLVKPFETRAVIAAVGALVDVEMTR